MIKWLCLRFVCLINDYFLEIDTFNLVHHTNGIQVFLTDQEGHDYLSMNDLGNDLDEIKFHVNLLPPTDDANVIIPRVEPNDDGWFSDDAWPAFNVTNGVPGMDSILDINWAERTDTILKYMEKAPDATWEFVFVDKVT